MIMNYIIRRLHILVLLAVLFSISSCKKYLEVDPDNRMRLTTLEDYKDLISGNYPEARHLFLELYTDNFRYYHYPDYNNANINSWLMPFYLWSDEYIQNNAVTPEAAWRHYYHVIYNMNVALEGLDQAVGTDEHLRESLRGEALLIRSYCHFMLVNIFGKHYNSQTAPSDLGVTYITETEQENIVRYTRETVKVVYDKAEEDALEGLALLNDTYVDKSQFHFTKSSAHAYLARLYLFKGEFENALEHALTVLEYNNSIRDLIDDHQHFEASFRVFADEYFSTSKPNVLLMKRTLEWNSFYLSGFYANEFRATFPTNDYRGKIYTRTGGDVHPNYYARKFRSLRTDGQQYSDIPLFSVEEAMITAMEAAVRKPNPEPQLAINLLNQLLVRRLSPFTALEVTDIGDNDLLLERIIEERRRELAYEGLRWFDIKRFDIPVTHYTLSGNITLEADDLRRVVQIPLSEFTANPEIQLNPR